MPNERFKEICEPIWRETGFRSVNDVEQCYKKELNRYKNDAGKERQQYSPSSIASFLRGASIGQIGQADLALYMMLYGVELTKQIFDALQEEPNGDGRKSYSSVADTVSNDSAVKRVKRQIGSEGDDGTRYDLSNITGKLILYGLLSARIEEEALEDGKKPLCVLGFIAVDADGRISGKAFRYFGPETGLKANGDLRHVEPLFVNSKSTILLEYELRRRQLPGHLDDRTGFIKAHPVDGAEQIVDGDFAYEGTYQDLDREGANIDGQALLRVIEGTLAQGKAFLEEHGEKFNAVLRGE